MGSVEKVNVNPWIGQAENEGSRGKYEGREEKDDTVEYRIKPSGGAFGEEGRDTPRLIEFSPPSQPDIAKWMQAAGIPDVVHRPLPPRGQERRELPPLPKTLEIEEYKFLDTGISHLMLNPDDFSLKPTKSDPDQFDKLSQIDKEIENLNSSMQRISKGVLNDQKSLRDRDRDREEAPYQSSIEPMKPPSPVNKKPSIQVFSPIPTRTPSNKLGINPSLSKSSIGLEDNSVMAAGIKVQGSTSFLGSASNVKLLDQITNSNQGQTEAQADKVLMNLQINEIQLLIRKGDTADKVAKRYFQKLGTNPSKKDLFKLAELIAEKINKKIDYLEKFFRRSIAKKEMEEKRPQTVSIDLSNKENLAPNRLNSQENRNSQANLKPQEVKVDLSSTQTAHSRNNSKGKISPVSSYAHLGSTAGLGFSSGGASSSGTASRGANGGVWPAQQHQSQQDRTFDSCSQTRPGLSGFTPKLKKPPSMDFEVKGNKTVGISVKRDDDPVELARIILIQRGLGLSNLDRLADNIREFQRRTYHSRRG